MITKVRLKNWRSHEDSEMNFSSGTNALIGIMGSGKSLPYSEPILIKEGNYWVKKEIGSIVENALKDSKRILEKNDSKITFENTTNIYVQCFDTRNFKIVPKKVVGFIKHKSPKKLVKIKTRTGRTVTLTKNHSLILFTRNGIELSKPSNIKIGSFLPSTKRIFLENCMHEIDLSEILSDFRNTNQILRGLELVDSGISCRLATEMTGLQEPFVLANWKRREIYLEPKQLLAKSLDVHIPQILRPTESLAIVIGAYLAEGSCDYSEDASRYSIKITNKNKSYLKLIRSSLKNIFPNVNSSIINGNLQINGKVVAAFFSRLFGKTSGEKHIPNFVFGFDDGLLQKLLMMYFEGDGWVCGENNVACLSKSPELVDNISSLLSKWGIITTFRERKIQGKRYYELNILPKHIPIFAKKIKFLDPKKNKKLLEMSKNIGMRKKWDGLDIIPSFFIKPYLESLIKEYNMSSRKNSKMRSLSKQFRIYKKYKNIGREKLGKSLDQIYKTYSHKTTTFATLEKIVNSDIFFDEIVDIKEVDKESEYVYDVSIPDLENFVAGLGNVIVHNSSVMDAICFAFFGTFPSLQSKKLKLEDILMKKPVEKEKGEVEITFELNNSLYSVRRVIEKGKGTSYCELKENGKIIDSPSSQRVTESVEKILKVNYELFSKAIYAEQNALDYFLTIPKGQRMRRIDELLMIDKFEKARSSAVSLANRLSDRKEDRESAIKFADVDLLRKNIFDLKGGMKNLLEERVSFATKLESIAAERARLEKEVSDLRKVKDNLELLKREQRGIESTVAETNSFIKNLDEAMKGKDRDDLQNNLETSKQKLAELDRKFRDSRANYEKIFSLIAETKTKLDYLKNDRIEKMEKEIAEKLRVQQELEQMKALLGGDIAKQIEEKRILYESLIEKHQEIRVKMKNLDDVVQQLSSLGGVCPICDSKLTEEKKKFLVKQKQLQIGALKSMLEEVAAQKEKSEREMRKIEEDSKSIELMAVDVGEFENMRDELKELKKVYVEMDESAKVSERQIGKIKAELEDTEKEKDEADAVKRQFELLVEKFEDYDSKRKRLEELVRNGKNIADKIIFVESKIAGRNVEELEKHLRQKFADERELETKILSSAQIAQEKESRIKECEMKLNDVLRQREEVKRLELLVKEIKIFAKALEHTQIELRREFVEAVNYSMSKLWTTLYPYDDFVGIKLSVDEGDYVLQLCERSGRWANVEGVASGGERSIACLALRIAFSLVLAPQLRTLILDEPTANLDAAAIDMLAKTLRERIYEFVDQCFIITHQPELEEAVTGRAYRLERDKKKDETTKVILLS